MDFGNEVVFGNKPLPDLGFLEPRKSLVYDACIQPKPVCTRHEARVPGERRPNGATGFNEVGSFGGCGGWRDRYLARTIYGG